MSDYRLLLERVARLYERYEAGRRKPFNVFSVLRRESDEVNLHSRFLHALFDYRKSPEARRENLNDFLQHVGKEEFEEKGVKVDREYNDIDILITNDARQAVVIENKIWARDQPEQLQKYYKQLKSKGYRDIHLLYLTPHGHKPSKDSVGELLYKTISYKDNLLPWLERCQQRAYDELELRVSVAQYRQLVRKLTGIDLTETSYMKELKNLLLQDKNLVLACHLSEAMLEVRIKSLKELWDEIESELKNTIQDLPDKGNNSDTSPERIRHFIILQKNFRHGLYYPFGRGVASIGVEGDHTIFFGVYCSETSDRRREYNKLKNALRGVSGGDPWPDGWWPWHKYVNNDLNLKDPAHRETCEMLLNKEKRREYVAEIADGLKKVWNTVEAAGLAR